MIKKDPTLQLDGAKIPLKYFASIEKKVFLHNCILLMSKFETNLYINRKFCPVKSLSTNIRKALTLLYTISITFFPKITNINRQNIKRFSSA